MKVLVVLSAVAALAAAQLYVPFANHGQSGYSTYGYHGLPYGHAGAHGLALRSYAPAVYGSQYHAQDALGGYQYGYADGQSNKVEHRLADGSTAGSYSYIDPNGQTQTVSYTAGRGGFQVKGSNLPVAPVAELTAPQPVQDTPEVKAARAAFQAAFDAASRQRRSAPQPVQDTAEVAAEKARFRVLYAESAAAAATDVTPVTSYLEDTADVAADKARFQAAFDAAAAARAAAPAAAAAPVASYLADTAEVAAEKARFQATYDAAAARAAAPAPITYAGVPFAAPYHAAYATPYAAPFRGFFNGYNNRFFY